MGGAVTSLHQSPFGTSVAYAESGVVIHPAHTCKVPLAHAARDAATLRQVVMSTQLSVRPRLGFSTMKRGGGDVAFPVKQAPVRNHFGQIATRQTVVGDRLTHGLHWSRAPDTVTGFPGSLHSSPVTTCVANACRLPSTSSAL